MPRGSNKETDEISQLRKAEEKFRLVVESAPSAMVMVDKTGKITLINQQTERLFGYSRNELVGQAIDFLVPPRFREKHPQDRSTFFHSPKTRAMGSGRDLYALRKNGTEVPVEIGLNPIDTAEGTFVLAAIVDITERKQLEEARLRLQLSTIIESSLDAIISKTLDGKILSCNKGAESLYGYKENEVKGQPVTILLPPNVPDEVPALIEKIKRGEIIPPYDAKRMRKDGTVLDVSITVSPLRNAEGQIIGSSTNARDITEQKSLQAELHRKNEELELQYRRIQEANRLKSEFLANMSHELRTPLNSVIGFSELIHDGKAGAVSETQKEFLGDILSSARHLLQLINDVLDLSKVESGKMEFHPEEVDLTALTTELRATLQTLAARKEIRMDVRISSEVKSVWTDSSRLKQVLYNYLSNAIKFTPERGVVILQLDPEGDNFFRLSVKDNGIGITKEDVKRLFIEFQQLDASVSKKYQGTGLGLALTKRIVEAQGGKVGVESEPGKGSNFFAVLPR